MSELYLVYVWVEGFSIDSTTQGDSPTSKALKSFPWVREGNRALQEEYNMQKQAPWLG